MLACFQIKHTLLAIYLLIFCFSSFTQNESSERTWNYRIGVGYQVNSETLFGEEEGYCNCANGFATNSKPNSMLIGNDAVLEMQFAKSRLRINADIAYSSWHYNFEETQIIYRYDNSFGVKSKTTNNVILSGRLDYLRFTIGVGYNVVDRDKVKIYPIISLNPEFKLNNSIKTNIVHSTYENYIQGTTTQESKPEAITDELIIFDRNSYSPLIMALEPGVSARFEYNINEKYYLSAGIGYKWKFNYRIAFNSWNYWNKGGYGNIILTYKLPN